MAQTPNEKAAKAIAKALDSTAIQPTVVAYEAIGEMTWMQQTMLFDFVVACIGEWASDPLDGYAGPDRHLRVKLSKTMKASLKSHGYTIF